MADRARRDLMSSFWDEDHGGFIWSVSANGRPVEPVHQVYGEAFAIYGLSEYHLASGSAKALDQAIEVYRLMERHARDRQYGGFHELFSADWSRLDPNEAAVMDVGSGSKTQNTHLHVMEAFTNLLRVWPDPELKREQKELVDIMLNRVLDRESWHLGLVFDDAWNLQSGGVSYGHDIEAAWLLCEAAEVVGDPDQIRSAREAAVGIARATLAEGVDTDGSLFYDGDRDGPVNRTKEWWPQAEGVVGFLQAWKVSGESTFLDAAVALWRFIETRHVDRVNGGWHKSIAPDGTVLPDNKIDRWTCPYHNGRACMEVYDRLGA
jgi:mannobiose 2-epimerase